MQSRLPMFHRIGAAAYKANLNSTINICNAIGNPEKEFKSIHIAGTNGKGSVSNILASILYESGYKTALFTSPHLKDFRERIRVNGKMIPKSYVVDFINKNKDKFAEYGNSFFEMTFALAADYFASENIDIAVMEVGMGGRLDSTNIINSIASVITNISYDHTAFLGNTLEKIAGEKAGIIKKGVPVIIGETQPKTQKVFRDLAAKNKCQIFFADQFIDIIVKNRKFIPKPSITFDVMVDEEVSISNIKTPLTGTYQERNFCTVLQTVNVLNKINSNQTSNSTPPFDSAQGDSQTEPACGRQASRSQTIASKNICGLKSSLNISNKSIKTGFKNTVKNTGFMGRWQVLKTNPLTICDTGHNEAGINEVLKMIAITPHKNLHIVFGMVNDKDFGAILKMMPSTATYYFCKPSIPRGLDAEILRLEALKYKLIGKTYNSVNEALDYASNNASNNDLVFIGGSTFVVAEVV